MADIKYVYKFKNINKANNTINYKYLDCFTGETKNIIGTENNPIFDLEFESKMKIVRNGEWVLNTRYIDKHICSLMRTRQDGMEFTVVSIYLEQNDIVKCNIELSTAYMQVSSIIDFVETLINSTEDYGENVMKLVFSRPDIDVDFFVINVKY